MIDLIDEFGYNAGKVWEILNTNGPLTQTAVMKHTKLDARRFHAAIGWLARENKICKDDNMYRLGDTNLTTKIGNDAGRVWRALEAWGERDVSSINRLAQLDERDLYSALGWLAKENKIEGKKGDAKTSPIKIKLK